MSPPHVAPHRAAMEAIDDAERARATGDSAGYRAAMRRALTLEARAARKVPDDLEPTRSILHRSAAAIAAQLGDTIEARRLAIAGLRGEPPAAIKAELFEVLDRLVPARAQTNEPTVVQQLRIRSASGRGPGLTIPNLAELQALFFQTINDLTAGIDDPLLLDASPGSFVVQYEIPSDEEDRARLRAAMAELRGVSEFLARAQQPADPSAPPTAQLGRVHGVLDLLTALTATDTAIEITTAVGEDDPESFELSPPPAEHLEHWQRLAANRIPSGDVPQADDLERVLRFVELLSTGHYPTPQTLDVVSRQINYYRRAAEVLGYVRGRVLTPAGRTLVETQGAARWTDVLEQVSRSHVGRAWIEWTRADTFLAIDGTTAQAFLEDMVVGLSKTTIRRRAVSLSAWHAKLHAETTG